MPIINLRFCIYAALFVGAIAFFMRYGYLSERVKQQDSVIQRYEAAFNKQAQQIKDADLARTEYLTNLQAAQNEIDTLRNSVSSGATVLRVKAACPKLPSTSTYTAGTIAASPELTEDARQDYYSLRQGISEINARLDLCVKTLEDERK